MFQERCVTEKNSFRDTYILATSKDLWPTVVPRKRGSLVVPLKVKHNHLSIGPAIVIVAFSELICK